MRLRRSIYAALVLVVAGAAALSAQASNGPIPKPAAKYKFEVRRDVMVPMRDGIKLATDLYLPTGAGDKLPVVLMRTPYNKATYNAGAIQPAEFFAGQGYAALVQDARGQFASEGNYRVQAADAKDGYDTIDWIVKQPWSTGKVGTYGCSYLGEVQYLLSKMRHPAHLAMIPQAASGATGPAGGFYTDFGAYEGGALTLSTVFGWFSYAGHKVHEPVTTVIGRNVPKIDFAATLRSLPVSGMARRADLAPSDFEDFVTHPPADPYWDEVGYLRDDDRFNVPALHINSWLDVTPEQTMYVFNLMRRNGETARARDNQFAIMSPTTHCGSDFVGAPVKVGDREFGDSRLPFFQLYLDWFDHWLKGVENGVTKRPKVQYYVMGKNEWRSAPSWPVPGMRLVPYYLSSTKGAATSSGDGALAVTRPVRAGQDTYIYDPDNPIPSKGGTICCTGDPADQPGIFDQSDRETRSDLLVFTTAALARGVTIAGAIKARLYVSSDAKDTDFTAKLMDVDEQGRSWNVVNGILRARYREGMTKKVLMEKGKVYPVEVSLKATAFYFPPGHRIRLWVSSSDFPMYDRNLNTGGTNYDETTWVKATNT
ncbi:MAG: CocE/NonD family hydrolase, partial [Gemmatimonadota bacterium]